MSLEVKILVGIGAALLIVGATHLIDWAYRKTIKQPYSIPNILPGLVNRQPWAIYDLLELKQGQPKQFGARLFTEPIGYRYAKDGEQKTEEATNLYHSNCLPAPQQFRIDSVFVLLDRENHQKDNAKFIERCSLGFQVMNQHVLTNHSLKGATVSSVIGVLFKPCITPPCRIRTRTRLFRKFGIAFDRANSTIPARAYFGARIDGVFVPEQHFRAWLVLDGEMDFEVQ